MREIHGIVMRQIGWQRKVRQPKRRDLVVSVIGGLAHCGPEYTPRYADEDQSTQIMSLHWNIFPSFSKRTIPMSRRFSSSMIFIGSGDALSSALTQIPPAVKETLNQKGLLTLLLVIAGYSKGTTEVESAIEMSGGGEVMNCLCAILFVHRKRFLKMIQKSFHFLRTENVRRILHTSMGYGLNLIRRPGTGTRRHLLCLRTRYPTTAFQSFGNRRAHEGHYSDVPRVRSFRSKSTSLLRSLTNYRQRAC